MLQEPQRAASGSGTVWRRPRRIAAARLVLQLSIALLCALASHSAAAAMPITLLTIDGAIGPATADYVERGLARAAEEGSQLVILKIDTPGGLDTSMRQIIKAILTSTVPVASYVAPGGARAASAGTYILYASHIAAMAPGTNLGAATPVQIGGAPVAPEPEKPAASPENSGHGKDRGDAGSTDTATTAPMTRKEVNDAAAYLRGLAQLRGRNAEWAERTVREAVSLSADEALRMGVIDYVAADLPALNSQLDGKKVTALGQERLLRTSGAAVIDAQPDWHSRLLAAITNPSVALLLMTVGIYGLLFEFMNPGLAVPGVIGAICVLLALYALQLLPVNYVGLALILLGLACMTAEAFLPSFGVLGVGGIAAFVAGALILVDTDAPGWGIPLPLIVAVAVISAGLMVAIAGVALKTRRRAIVGGLDNLVDSQAEVVDETPGASWVRVRGETWRAVSHAPLHRQQRVRVVARNGLVLEVVPAGHYENGG